MNNKIKGLIIKGIAGFYYVKSGDTVYRCKARGIFKQRGIKPAVGDRVEIELIPDNDDNLITDILPRNNSFIRPFIANVDCFVIVTAVAKPAPVLSVIDRFLVMAEKSGTEIILCINKCDFARYSGGNEEKEAAATLELLKKIYEPIYPLVCLDCENKVGFDELSRLIKGKTVALAGASGVGKSTILNILKPEAIVETGEISEKSKRGKHTTRHSELFALEGEADTFIFDTPGFTSFEVLDAEEEELQHLYPEIEKELGHCKYHNCRHIAEPQCGVIKALNEGRISQFRYESYKSQLQEIIKSKQY